MPIVIVDARTWKKLLNRVTQLEEQMTETNADQGRLDTDVANLNAVTVNIEAELANLKAAHPAIDFTGLEAAIGQLGTDQTPPPPPA